MNRWKRIVQVSVMLLAPHLAAAAEPASPRGLRFRTGSSPLPVVGACDGLAAPGVWQEITPPEVKAGFDTLPNAGAFAFAVDPVNSGTLYLGTIQQKIWKSTDCGANWVPIATGRGGANLNSGMNWTFVIDPTDTRVLYTNAGYGQTGNGLYKSVNGGVDWDVVWPPASQPALGAFHANNFVNTVAMDPADNRHLLLTFHEPCLNRPGVVCIGESFDGGSTWTLLDGDVRWNTGGEGVRAAFLEDGDTWLWGSQSDGLWRTTDGGASWSLITAQGANHLQTTQFHRAANGRFYAAGWGGLLRSPAGGSAGAWTEAPNTSPLPGGIVSDGTKMFMSNCYYENFCGPNTPHVYFTSPENDGLAWTPMAGPAGLTVGGILGYDPPHKLLFSSNLRKGFWRMVTP